MKELRKLIFGVTCYDIKYFEFGDIVGEINKLPQHAAGQGRHRERSIEWMMDMQVVNHTSI